MQLGHQCGPKQALVLRYGLLKGLHPCPLRVDAGELGVVSALSPDGVYQRKFDALAKRVQSSETQQVCAFKRGRYGPRSEVCASQVA